MSRAARAASLWAVALAGFTGAAEAQAVPEPRPRLVVVLAVDQMRPDYLDRFRPWFGRRGFRLFLDRGATFTAARYDHADTSTCPGHAVMLTGTHADVNGIVSNEWYDAAEGREEYCVGDRAVRPVGTSASNAGRSPRNLLVPTVGDLLETSTGGRSRVIAVAPKDRSAIMLGGRRPDAVYWMQDSLFVTSTWYRDELPAWVRSFNASGAVSTWSGKTWDRLLPPKSYQWIGPDDGPAEEDAYGMRRTFPHPLRREHFIDAFNRSPFSNEVVAEFVMRAVAAEGLGRDEIPDLLAVGFSANDLGGHAFGPDSHEVMDLTIRLDRVLEKFFGFLDREIGLEHVVIVLTADHGVATIPEVLAARDPAAGAARVPPASVRRPVEAALTARFGALQGRWIVYDSGRFLYLNLPALRARRIPVAEAERVARDALRGVPAVHAAATTADLERERRAGTRSAGVRSFHPSRSGNVYYELRRNLLSDSGPTGTGHGSPWDYDSRVPLLWFGGGIRPGTYAGAASVADIAPTLAELLRLPTPATSQGRVLRELWAGSGNR